MTDGGVQADRGETTPDFAANRRAFLVVIVVAVLGAICSWIIVLATLPPRGLTGSGFPYPFLVIGLPVAGVSGAGVFAFQRAQQHRSNPAAALAAVITVALTFGASFGLTVLGVVSSGALAN